MIIFFVFMGLVTTVSTARGYLNELKRIDNKPPKCYENARFPGETCSTFFQYNSGKIIKMICPPGYSYWDLIGECTNQVTCRDPVCLNGQIESAVDSNRVVSCEIYAQCEMNQWQFSRCKNGTYFDFVEKKCLKGRCPQEQQQLPDKYYPDNVQYPGYGLPDPVGPPVLPEHSDQLQYPLPQYKSQIPKTCSPNSGKIADRLDCTRFWSCNEFGFFSNFECPRGTVFSGQKCIRGTCTPVQSTVCPPNLFLPTETCGEYKFCQNNQWISGFCDNNRVFFDGKCQQSQCSNPAVDDAYANQAECRHDQVKVNFDDPNQYFYCFYGKWFERRCAKGESYNWKFGQCVANNRPPPPPPHCQNGEVKGVAGDKPTPDYKECVDGRWVDKCCSFGFQFNNGFCVRQPVPVTSCMVGQGSGYRRVPHECSSFYQCDHGTWIKRPCAPGTVWNDAVLTCDWPANVPECSAPQFQF